MLKNGKQLILQSQNKVIDNQQLMERAENLALDIYQKITQQIKSGNLQIPKNRQNVDQLIKQNTLRQKSKSVPHLYAPVPLYTNEDQQITKQMIMKQKQYQQKLQNKARQLEQAIKLDEQQHKRYLQQQKKKQFEQKKLKVMQSIQQIKKRHQSRQKLKHDQNLNILAVKSGRKLFETFKQKWDKIQASQKEQKQKSMLAFLEKRKISFDQIKQHAVKHDQTMSKFRQSRIAQSKVSQFQNKKFYQSTFMSRIIEEDQQLKEDYQYKKIRAKELAEKKAEYGELVRQNFKPQVRQSSRALQPQIKVSKSLSYFQTVRQGNDYLKQGNTRIIHQSISSSKLNAINQKKQFFQYKNYLTEIRIKKDELQREMNMNQRISKQKKYEKQIKKIMSDPEISEQEKFIKAKLVTKRMQSQQYRKNPLKIIDSIKAKIQILKHVST